MIYSYPLLHEARLGRSWWMMIVLIPIKGLDISYPGDPIKCSRSGKEFKGRRTYLLDHPVLGVTIGNFLNREWKEPSHGDWSVWESRGSLSTGNFACRVCRGAFFWCPNKILLRIVSMRDPPPNHVEIQLTPIRGFTDIFPRIQAHRIHLKSSLS